MAEIVLTPASPLGGYARDFGATRLAEVTGLAIVSAAIPQGGETEAEQVLDAVYGIGLPRPGRSLSATDGATRILWTAPDQLWLVFPHPTPDAGAHVAAATGEAFRLTDLSDALCTLDISGPATRDALARICPLDLHPQVFGPDHCARTAVEHLSATILRRGDDAFRMISARSSAQSFLHAAETALAAVT